MKGSPLLILPALGLCSSLALAEQAASEPIASLHQEERMTVVGTRTERNIDQVDATVTVIDSETIERRLMRDIRDLVRYEPGVSVGGTGSRFGLEGFNIRGVDGNRVLTIVDGIRVPDEFSFGPFLSAQRDLVDIDSISRAEIARGPISTLYGSDALGGVVAFRTRSPFDYVSAGEPVAADLKAGYSSANDGWVGTGTFAGGNDRVAGLVSYTRREASETINQGEVGGTGQAREKPDPQAISTRNLQLKGALALNDAHTLTLGFVDYANETDTQVLSDYGTLSQGTLVNTRDAVDERARQRYSLEYAYDRDNGLLHHAQGVIYYQTSETRQDTVESRTPPGGSEKLRQRLSHFEQDIAGFMGQLGRSFEGAGRHEITLGGEFYQTDSRSLREGFTVDAATGAPVFEFFPLPTRDFPTTRVRHAALFLQDEMTLLDGRLLVTPGVRWDAYDAKATADDIYRNGNPGIAEPVDYRDSDVTFKLGGVFAFNQSLSAYARYSEGFRAPPYDDVNVGFTNFIGGYKTIANPDLVSETSAGVEAGLRFTGAWGNVQLSAFRTDFDNFIESLAIAPAFAPSGIDPRDGLVTFQSINRTNVRIEGWEARGLLDLGMVSSRLSAFALEGAIAYAEGADRDDGTPLNSIEPLNTVLGLRWAPVSWRVSSELIWTWSDAKDEADIDGDRLATNAWNVLDLVAHVQLGRNWLVDVGVFNITDETYIRWADTVAIGEDAPARFTQPGRNFSATLRATF